MEPDAPVLDPMAQTALRTLKDIVVPVPVSWIPHTWGWALVGLLLLAVLAMAIFTRIRRYRANAYRREALRTLAGIEARMRDVSARPYALGELASLLKRTALVAWPRAQVADLSGREWAQFIRSHGEQAGASVLESLVDDFEYHADDTLRNLPSNVCDTLIEAARNWIERHHVPA